MPSPQASVRPRTPAEVAAWLREKPTLAQMRAAFPQEWDRVQAQVAQLVRTGGPDALAARLKELTAAADPAPDHRRQRKVLVAEAVRRQMLIEAVRQAVVSRQTGVTGGTLRLGLVNGFVLQRLLFEHDLRRKAARSRLFRAVWPLLPQRSRLMPLVMAQGIYCFYSRSLLRGIARLAAGRPCLEIAAGDGTLSRLLAAQGVDVVATDDHSWGIDVRSDGVETMDAAAALRHHAPRVVLCSWPPPGNPFEKHVFRTPSVELYVLVTSRHELAAGDWEAYRRQTGFEMTEDRALTRHVLPPGSDAAVYVFRRTEPVPAA